MSIQASGWQPNPECKACERGYRAMLASSQREAKIRAQYRKRIAKLEAALKQYGQHKTWKCSTAAGCVCGFDAALSGGGGV